MRILQKRFSRAYTLIFLWGAVGFAAHYDCELELTQIYLEDNPTEAKRKSFWKTLGPFFENVRQREGKTNFEPSPIKEDHSQVPNLISDAHNEGITLLNHGPIKEQRKAMIDLKSGDDLAELPLGKELPFTITGKDQFIPNKPILNHDTNLRLASKIILFEGAHHALTDFEPTLAAGELEFSYEKDPKTDVTNLVCTVSSKSGTYKQKEIGRLKYVVDALFDRRILPDVIRFKAFDAGKKDFVSIGEFKPQELNLNVSSEPIMTGTYFHKSQSEVVRRFYDSGNKQISSLKSSYDDFLKTLYAKFPNINGSAWNRATIDTAAVRKYLLRNVGHILPAEADEFLASIAESSKFGSEQGLFRYLVQAGNGAESTNYKRLSELISSVEKKLNP